MMDGIAVRLLELGTATLGESGGLPMEPRISAAWAGARLAAPAYPVGLSPADNLAIHVAVAEAPAGSALVVAVAGEPDRGYWGEVLTTGAEARGLRGLVIDGGVRDTAALLAHGFPVFSRNISLRGAGKTSGGTVGSPVTVGGVEVSAGDWVVGDSDGVTVVRAAELANVLAAADTRTAKEQEMFAALRAGRTTMELLDLDGDSVQRG